MARDFLDTKEMLEAIISTIDEGIHVVNAQGLTIYYNPIAAKHDGLEGAEVLGKHLLEVFPSLTSETSTLLKVIETGEPIANQHQTYTNLRGQYIHTVNTTLPLHVSKELVGAIEVAKDLSRVKELSEKLLDLQARVQRNGKQNAPKETADCGARFQMSDMITQNKQLEKVKETGLKIAKTSSPILIYGETGTGKELLVQSIHNASPRRDQAFIAQNCAAIPSTLLEGILFGTVKGSFTGAVDRPGLFELANGGTLFLDELNSMPLEIQVKLLRVLQDGVVRRVGATKGYTYDVRIVAAMNEDPLESIKNNRLRADLYYRINVISLRIPALIERLEDLELLVPHFIQKYNFRFQKLITHVDQEVVNLFKCYPWPGNIRELEHAIEAAMNMIEGDTLKKEHLPEPFLARFSDISVKKKKLLPLRQALEETEQNLIERALKETEGNIQQAAKLLSIPRQTLQYKLSKLKKQSRVFKAT